MQSAEYESYDTTSSDYDSTRQAIGLDILWGALASTSKTVAEIAVIDAACGTGNYAAALAPHVASVRCLDLSAGMLEQAKEKLGYLGTVQFQQANAVEFPVDDDSADAIMLNQAAHHFEDPGVEERFDKLGAFIARAAKVLRPGGVLSINTSSRPQVVDGYWWADLIPEAVATIGRRYPPLATVQAQLIAAGFHNVRSYVPLDAVLQQRNYLDAEGPLREDWRNGDSTWSLVSIEELAQAQARVRKMLETGKMNAYLAEREVLRAKLGQTTFVLANLPARSTNEGRGD
jgi:ubiquinone/menaquinone biosynthesis C-methylase UbiE